MKKSIDIITKVWYNAICKGQRIRRSYNIKNKESKMTKNTKNTKNTKQNAELVRALASIKKQVKNARESSQLLTASFIWAFLTDKESYKTTAKEINEILKNSFNPEDWTRVRGGELRKVRYARLVFESRLEALESCKDEKSVLLYLKNNESSLSYAKVLNIKQNQKKKVDSSESSVKKIQPVEVNPESLDKSKANPNPESAMLETVAFLKSIAYNKKLMDMLNEKIKSAGIRITYGVTTVKKSA